jgi:hypothetical protein
MAEVEAAAVGVGWWSWRLVEAKRTMAAVIVVTHTRRWI